MKNLSKRILVLIIVVIIYLGVITLLPIGAVLSKPMDNDEVILQLASSDGIKDWDIAVDEVKQVEIHAGSVHVVLTEEEGMRIIHAFNAIQNKDVNWDYSLEKAYEFGPMGIGITVVMNDGEEILINPTQDYRIGYKGELYATRYHLDIFDEVRQLQTKYGYQWTNNSYHKLAKYSKMIFGTEIDSVVSPEIRIIEISPYNESLNIHSFSRIIARLPFYGFKTINDYLKPYEGKLVINDAIETKHFIIKVIEIVDGKVTAVSVSDK